MNIVIISAVLAITFAHLFPVAAQRKMVRPATAARGSAVLKPREIGSSATVIDETLSILRAKPSLFAEPLQRMRRGRMVRILGTAEADGVRFYRVAAPPNNTGWVQAECVFGKFRPNDAERLARLVQASSGFDQIELAASFFELFPDSPLRPSLLLLFGDLLEEAALKLSKDALNRLDRREMAASGAPLHSYYLNFVMLDRYRKLGAAFLFNPASRAYHYDGASWKEIVLKFSKTAEAAEAQKRLDSLKLKMEKR